jgi:hypothetical protein
VYISAALDHCVGANMSKQRSTALLVILLSSPLFFRPLTYAQEVDCTIRVNYEAVAATGKELLVDFGEDVRQYVNNYKWGPENLDQKIKCTMDIFIQSITGDDRYAAQVFIGSKRPIFGTEKSSAVVRLLDDNWEFTYIRGRSINHNPYTFNDLASFLDFYVYLVIGFDYDTYEILGGTPFFQKASEIASLGRSSGQKGWQLTAGSYSRLQLMDEILNPKFAAVRKASYTYHYAGLDSLAVDPQRGTANILAALEAIGKTRKEVDPRTILIKVFFEAKNLEIADVFAHYPDRSVYLKLGEIDPSHIQTYEEYRARDQ